MNDNTINDSYFEKKKRRDFITIRVLKEYITIFSYMKCILKWFLESYVLNTLK